MRAQKTIKKLLRKLEDPEKAAATMFNEAEIWGMKYVLKWVLHQDLSALMAEADERCLNRKRRGE